MSTSLLSLSTKFALALSVGAMLASTVDARPSAHTQTTAHTRSSAQTRSQHSTAGFHHLVVKNTPTRAGRHPQATGHRAAGDTAGDAATAPLRRHRDASSLQTTATTRSRERRRLALEWQRAQRQRQLEQAQAAARADCIYAVSQANAPIIADTRACKRTGAHGESIYENCALVSGAGPSP
ncbi:MAG: hypothetical protein JSR26_05490 [Proteobacteria bacterium]|nr:hypothetical protein [Pseudomonadota bacterium]